MYVVVVLYLGWADIALSTVLVEGPDESLTYGAKSKQEEEKIQDLSTQLSTQQKIQDLSTQLQKD